MGKRVCDDPPTIQLTFEHKIGDQDLGQDAFYTASRDNRCVVCASKTHLLRYRVRWICIFSITGLETSALPSIQSCLLGMKMDAISFDCIDVRSAPFNVPLIHVNIVLSEV